MNNRINYITVLKALGILLVVGGHMGGIFLDIGIPFYNNMKPIQIFPAYSYHMPLFIFASGYFFKDKYLDDFYSLLKKRVKSLIIPYYAWNLFYGLLCMFLVYINIPNKGQTINLYNFFVTPLLEGNQYDFNLPAWFLIVLFFVQIFYTIIKIALHKKIGLEKSKVDHITLIALTIIVAGSIYISNTVEDITSYAVLYFFSRVFFGMLFYHFGYYYKNYVEDKINLNFLTLVVLIAIKLSITLYLGKNFTFSMRTMLFRGVTIIPIVFSVFGIFYILNVSKLVEQFLERFKWEWLGNLLEFIGNNTFAIMMHHMLMNFVLYRCFRTTLENYYIWDYAVKPILCVALAIGFHMILTKAFGYIWGELKKLRAE